MKFGHLEAVFNNRSLGDLQLTMVINDWVDPPSTWLEVPTIDTLYLRYFLKSAMCKHNTYYTSNNPRTPQKSGSVVTSIIGLFSNWTMILEGMIWTKNYPPEV